MTAATGSRNEVRMILLGKTGSGKSSFGNTIMGDKKFLAANAPNGVTKECACTSREFGGKRLFVVDTPGFLDPSIERESIQAEVAKAYQVTALPGPHAFLLVIEPGRFTLEEEEAVKYLGKIFGSQAIDHTIIIFTHGDSFDPPENTIEEYLKMLLPTSALRIILDQCKGRYLLVNNKGTEKEKEKTIDTLLGMIASMVANNNGQVYRTALFDAAAEVIASDTFKGINRDGTIALHPKIKELIVEGFLRRTVGKKVVG